MEFAKGQAGDGGVFGFAVDLGNELAGDAGDERIFRTLGERGDFLIGGGDGDLVVEFEADEAGFPGFEDFFQAAGGLDAERAFERKQ